MRKNLSILFIFSLLEIFGQITFPAPGAKWHYAKYTFANSNIYNETVTVGSNTVIAGKSCNELVDVRCFNYCGSIGPTFVYASGDSVYFNNYYTLNQWQLLYNFNALAGQGWEFYITDNGDTDTIKVVVDSVKTVIINTLSLKALFVTYHHYIDYGTGFTMDATGNSIIYDRIGDVGYLLNYFPDFYGICDDGGIRFLCYEDSLMPVYQHDSLPCNYTNVGVGELAMQNQLKVFPNPTTKSIIVEMDGIGQDFDLLNAQGDKVSHAMGSMATGNLAEGIYFVHVNTNAGVLTRKIVVKH